jgi:hypothetical protein
MRAEAPPDSPGGRVADWFRRQVAAGRDLPPERAADLIVALARGDGDDLTALVGRAAEIRREDLFTLRLRESAPAG